VVALINGFGSRPRSVAGEADDPYPDPVATLPSLPGVDRDEAVRQADRLWPVFGTDPEEAARLLSDLARTYRLSPMITADGVLGWSTGRTGAEAARSAALVATVLDVVRRSAWRGSAVARRSTASTSTSTADAGIRAGTAPTPA
jgi:hypothetical protein